MSGPYRESERKPPAPVAELQWRNRVANSARRAASLLLSNYALLLLRAVLPPQRLEALLGVLWLATGAGLAATTWTLTARRPHSRVHWLAWVIRAAVLAYLGVGGLTVLGLGIHIVAVVCIGLVAAGFAGHVGLALQAMGDPAAAQDSRRRVLLIFLVGVMWVSIIASIRSGPWAWMMVGFVAAGGAERALRDLRRALRIRHHHWWFDSEMEPPGEWVALLVHRDKHAEVLCLDETLGRFGSEDEATEWLEANGYVPAERAVEERLVAEAPPDVLKVRARNKLRAASTSPQPRVRVAPEASDDTAHEAADGAGDEMDDNAPPDEPEPPRAVAVDDPHDPRT